MRVLDGETPPTHAVSALVFSRADGSRSLARLCSLVHVRSTFDPTALLIRSSPRYRGAHYSSCMRRMDEDELHVARGQRAGALPFREPPARSLRGRASLRRGSSALLLGDGSCVDEGECVVAFDVDLPQSWDLDDGELADEVVGGGAGDAELVAEAAAVEKLGERGIHVSCPRAFISASSAKRWASSSSSSRPCCPCCPSPRGEAGAGKTSLNE